MEYCIAGKFGGELNLAVYLCNHRIKIHQYFILAYISRVLPRKSQGLVGGHGLGGVCDYINKFGCHIKEIRLLRQGGGGLLC